METIRNWTFSNKNFINWMLSTSSTRRVTLLKDIGEFLSEKGLADEQIINACKQIQIQPTVAVKRLSSKETLSYKRGRKKSSFNLKKVGGSRFKDDLIDDSGKGNNDFFPIITSVMSLRSDEDIGVFQSDDKIDQEQHSILEVSSLHKTIITNNFNSSSNLENSVEEYERKDISQNYSKGYSLNDNKLTNNNSIKTKQLTVSNKKSSTDHVNQNNEIIPENKNETEVQEDNLQLQNNIISNKSQPSGNNKKIKIIESTKVKNKKLEENMKQNLSNTVSLPKIKGEIPRDSNSDHIVYTSINKYADESINKDKVTSQSLEIQDIAISLPGSSKEVNKTVKSQFPIFVAGTMVASNEKNKCSANSQSRDNSEKVESFSLRDEMSSKEDTTQPVKQHSKPATLKQKKSKTKKEAGQKTSSKAEKKLDKSNVGQLKINKDISSQDRLTEKDSINRKRTTQTSLNNIIPKKMLIDNLNKHDETLSENSQIVKGKQQTNTNEMTVESINTFKHQEVPTSSINQLATTSNVSLDTSQSDNILSNPNQGNMIVESSANNINNIEKDCSVSEHAISDSTVSSSSMIEKPSKSPSSLHDMEIVIGSVTSENNPSFVSPRITEPNPIKIHHSIPSNSTDKRAVLPLHLGRSLEDKILPYSIHLYISCFENPNELLNSVPNDVKLAMKNYIIFKDSRDSNITVYTVIKEYLSLYIKHFDEANTTANKASEILHLAIADYSRREERKKLALRLNSDFLRNEELIRADLDYKEMLKVRGDTFSRICNSLLEKFEKPVFMLMTITFYFKIMQALLLIDSENIKHFSFIRHLMENLFSTQVSKSCYQFFNLSDAELKEIYVFVKNCLVSLYLTRYVNSDSCTQDPNEFKFALLQPCSERVRTMILNFIGEHESVSKDMFVDPNTSNKPSSTGLQEDNSKLCDQNIAMVNVELNKSSSTQFHKTSDDQFTNASRYPDIRCDQNLSSNQASLAFEDQPITDQQYVEQNQNKAQLSLSHSNEMYNKQDQFVPMQKPSASSDNHLQNVSQQINQLQTTCAKETKLNQLSLLHSNEIYHKQAQFVPMQKPNASSDNNFQNTSQQINQLQTTCSKGTKQNQPAKAIGQEQVIRRNQVIQTSMQQPNTSAIVQNKFNILPTQKSNPKSTNLGQYNQMQQQSFKGSVGRNSIQIPQQQHSTVQIQQQLNNQVYRQNNLVTAAYHQNRFQAPVQRPLLQTPTRVSKGSDKRLLIRSHSHSLAMPVSLPPVPSVTIHHGSTAQKSVPQPSLNIESSTSLPRFHNFFDQTQHLQSFQPNGYSRQNETTNRSIVTNMAYMQTASQNTTIPPNLLPPPYQTLQNLLNQVRHPPELSTQQQPIQQENQRNDNFLIMDHSEYKTCAVSDCQRPATVACSLCRAVFYCSCDCQKNHWYNEHSGKCYTSQ